MLFTKVGGGKEQVYSNTGEKNNLIGVFKINIFKLTNSIKIMH